MTMLPELDSLLHSQLRLQIVSTLIGLESATFNYLLEKTGASRGNISVQLKKLEDAGYLEIHKSFGKSYPITTCKLTPKGRQAFENYVEAISKYLDINTPKTGSK